MRYIRSDELDALADSISDSLLHECLDILTIQYTWRLSSYATFEPIDDFHSWEDRVRGMFSLKHDSTLCVIVKIKEHIIYSTFALINPAHLSLLAPELRKIVDLRVFL